MSLGVVGAIHEIEYMKQVAENFNPSLKWYQLGELVLNCPKVNYKLNYKPGQIICPRSKQMVYFDDVKDKIEAYSKMPIKYKKEQLKVVQLVEYEEDKPLKEELMADILGPDMGQFPFLYENRSFIPISNLQPEGQKHVLPLVKQMMLHIGIERFQDLILELKFQKKKPEEEKKEESQEAAS